jgi:hypothetical protein
MLGWWSPILVTNAVTASRDLLPQSVSPVRLWLASDTELVLVGMPALGRR